MNSLRIKATPLARSQVSESVFFATKGTLSWIPSTSTERHKCGLFSVDVVANERHASGRPMQYVCSVVATAFFVQDLLTSASFRCLPYLHSHLKLLLGAIVVVPIVAVFLGQGH